jgi:lipopolysaccharide/colanic/teichoic acid biosynthesis glycosyltransferase
MSVYTKFFKNVFDIGIAIVALIILLPICALICVAIFFTMGRPIIFLQDRGGKNGTVFKLYKFRTMSNETDEQGKLLTDNKRLTKLGKFLRSASLDELPGILNVLRGELSLVGPRPFIAEYLPLYSDEQKKRHNVKPGITGWAQINGRNNLSWEEKFKLDVWYVDNQSILLDLKILLLTIKKVLTRDGVSSAGHVTSEKFKGNL